MNRRESAGIPIKRTSVDKNNVKKVKLATKPMTTPIGLFLPDVSAVDDKIMGKSGRIQGDKTVTTPAKKAKVIKSIILSI